MQIDDIKPGSKVTYRKPCTTQDYQAKLIRLICNGFWKAERSDGHTVEIMTPWIVDAQAPEVPAKSPVKQLELF